MRFHRFHRSDARSRSKLSMLDDSHCASWSPLQSATRRIENLGNKHQKTHTSWAHHHISISHFGVSYDCVFLCVSFRTTMICFDRKIVKNQNTFQIISVMAYLWVLLVFSISFRSIASNTFFVPARSLCLSGAAPVTRCHCWSKVKLVNWMRHVICFITRHRAGATVFVSG